MQFSPVLTWYIRAPAATTDTAVAVLDQKLSMAVRFDL